MRTGKPGTLGAVRRGHAAQAVIDIPAAIAAAGSISQITGDVNAGPGPGSVVATIQPNVVTDAKLRDSAALSVIGRSANTSGDPADIVAANDDEVLRRSGTAVGFGKVKTGGITDAAVTLAKLADLATQRVIGRNSSGTGVPEAVTISQLLDWLSASVARGDLAMRGSATWDRLAPGTAGLALTSGGAAADLVYAKLLYAALQDVSATSKILGRKSSGSGVIEELSASDVLTILGISNAGSAIYTGTGHPQGVTSAAIGSEYIDTNTGYRYRKVGGASTAYGWYYQPLLGAGSRGPLPWNAYAALPLGVGDTAAFSTVESSGLMGTGGGAAVTITNTTANSQARTLVSGKAFGQAQTGGTSGNVSSVRGVTTVTTSRLLDDDIDFTVELRTGASVTNVRIWIGLTSADITSTTTLGSGGNGAIAMRFIAGTDGGWVGYTCSGAGGNGVTTTVASISANTTYLIRVRFIRQGGTPTAYFSVDDGTEISLTTNIPATGAFFFPMIGWETRENSAKVLLWRVMGAVIGN